MKYLRISIFLISFLISWSISAQINRDSIQLSLEGIDKRDQITLLIEKSEEFRTINGDLSLFYARLALEKANLLKEEELVARSIYAKMKAHNILANNDSIILLYNDATELSDNLPKDLLVDLKKTLAHAYNKKDVYSEARLLVDEIIGYYESNGDSMAVYEVSSLSGGLHFSQGDIPNALNCFQRALKIVETERDTSKIFLLYSSIGNMYVKVQDFESARKYLYKGLSISKGFESDINYKTLMSSLGSFYNRTHVYDSAAFYYDKSLKATIDLNKRDDIAGAYLNLGNLNCRMGNFITGKAYFDTAIHLFKELNMLLNVARVYDSYGVMYSVQKKYDSSSYYLKKRLEISEELGEVDGIRRSLYLLAANFDKTGDYQKSLKYAKKYILFNDSIVGDEIQSKIADYEAKYETAKKERDIIQLKAERKAQEAKELLLWISFISVSLILLLIVWVIYQKRKKDGIIHQKEQLVLKNKKALADSELEKSKLQEEELKKEIQYKSKQLTTHALNMMQKNTLMQEIQEELVILSKRASQENKGSFSRIKMLIKKNLRSEKDWDLFKLYFEDVNKHFYEELQKITSELTSNDLKLCALLKLNMNIKESASVLNIEPASVKTARYKLRKKLNLNPEEDLVEFIRKID